MATEKGYCTFAVVLRKFLNPASFYSQLATKDRTSLAIVLVTSVAAGLLPRKPIGGDIVQTILRVSLTFAFTCGFSSMYLRYYQKSKAARVFKISAAIWMTSATAVLLYQIFKYFR